MQSTKPINLVLDKSYLYACSGHKMSEITQGYKFLITNSLTFEVLKDSAEERAKLFRKLPATPMYCEYIPEISKLIQFEIETKTPCKKPSEHIKPRDYSAIERFKDPNFSLDEKQKTAMESERDFINNLNFNAVMEVIVKIYETKSKQEISKNLQELENGKINDIEFINNFIKAQAANGANTPKVSRFAPDWITYRYFQVYYLCAIDTCNRYEDLLKINSNEKVQEKIRHDIHDMSYLILGLLEGGLATKEKKIIKWWQLLSNGCNVSILT